MQPLIENQMVKSTFVIDTKNDCAQLNLDMLDVFKLEDMLENIADLSTDFINENHKRLSSLIVHEVKKQSEKTKSYVQLLEFINKMFLTIGQNGDFARVLYDIMRKEAIKNNDHKS